MATPKMAKESLSSLRERLADARSAIDDLFALLQPEALYRRPIPERHRLIFYLGHLEAFDWNMLGRGALELASFDPDLDKLFAFGIDPVGGQLPNEPESAWPRPAAVRQYNERVKAALDEALGAPPSSLPPLVADGTMLHAAIEHRLMHAETLAYLLHQLPDGKNLPPSAQKIAAAKPVAHAMLEIPDGTVTLGMARQPHRGFGWDNEFEAHTVKVPKFRVRKYPVTNGEFLDFVRDGGYQIKRYWNDADWNWRESAAITHPQFWVKNGDAWDYHGMFEDVPLPMTAPVYVSHAEAHAYSRWAQQSLPGEAQWHRAAYGTRNHEDREFPWGNQSPSAEFGNFDFHQWDPEPVNAHPQGDSAFGVADLLGNGWEWTSTVFAPFKGFEAFSFYPGYSANFFDGKHYVMKGGSPRTAACMLRRSFRNWFQPHYPYVYAKFRTVEAAED